MWAIAARERPRRSSAIWRCSIRGSFAIGPSRSNSGSKEAAAIRRHVALFRLACGRFDQKNHGRRSISGRAAKYGDTRIARASLDRLCQMVLASNAFCMWNRGGRRAGFRMTRRAFLGNTATAQLAGVGSTSRTGTRVGQAWRSARTRGIIGKARSVICLFQHGGPTRWACSIPSRVESASWHAAMTANWKLHFHTQTGNILGPLPVRAAGAGISCRVLPWTGRLRMTSRWSVPGLQSR